MTIPWPTDTAGRRYDGIPDTHPHLNRAVLPLPPYIGATLNRDGTVTMHGMTYRYDGTQWVVV